MNYAWLDILDLIDFRPGELKYYPLMISLDKNCNVLSPKICVPKKTKDINVKVFDIITNKNKAKNMANQILCDCKCKFNRATCNSNQKWNNKIFQCECKNYTNNYAKLSPLTATVYNQ